MVLGNFSYCLSAIHISSLKISTEVLNLLLTFKDDFTLIVYIGGTSVPQHVQRTTYGSWVLSSFHMGPRDWGQACSSKGLYPVSSLASPVWFDSLYILHMNLSWDMITKYFLCFPFHSITVSVLKPWKPTCESSLPGTRFKIHSHAKMFIHLPCFLEDLAGRVHGARCSSALGRSTRGLPGHCTQGL